MKSFNVLALDSNYTIVGIVAYNNLQWSRKWHECGTFSISVPIEQYSSNWKYIYTKDRPELGKISQINYISENGSKIMMLSGYFLEKELDKMVVYPKNTTTDNRDSEWYFDNPSMSNLNTIYCNTNNITGSADVVALNFFLKFKQIDFWNYTGYNQATHKYFELDILQGNTESGIYKQADHYRNGEKLGYKIYDILKPSGASYRVRFNFDNNRKYFDILSSKDKTQDNTSGYNPIIFSTKYGNVINPNIVISENEYIDGCITDGKYSYKLYGQDKTVDAFSVFAKCNNDAVGVFEYVNSSINTTDYKIQDSSEVMTTNYDGLFNTFQYKEAMRKEMESHIQGKNVKTINIEFNTYSESYEYMTDFDIGDLVSLEIPEIELSADVRLIGCYEVIQDGKWTLSLEFGTPILIK